MTSFSRRLARIEPGRAAALTLGLIVVLPVAAFAFAAASSTPAVGAIVAAVALVAVAGSGLLYAWRLGPGGLGD